MFRIKKKNPLINKIILIMLGLIVLGLLAFVIVSKIYLGSVNSKDDTPIEFIVEPNTPKNTIADNLEKAGLIKNALFFKFYIKLNSSKELNAGTYLLTKSMSVNEIINVLSSYKSKENESISITFIEGKRLTDYVKKITESLNEYMAEDDKLVYKDVIDYLDSDEFVDKMIEKYWFITDAVKNENIYHPLEGYLFPDTYNFKKTATVDEIINKLVSTMGSKLEVYKDEIEISGYTPHELLTLASIVELEGANSDDRKGVAGVFYNRLENGWTLGSDVTTYYAVNKDFSMPLYNNDLKSCNGYNTSARSKCPIIGLPVGPIASPSLASIDAVIEPEEHEYYYFVADKYKKTYFSKTADEHQKTVSSLKKEGLWYEY